MGARYQPYPEYKECDGDWVNEIPLSWDIKRGKFLFDIKKRIVGELGYDVLSITQKGVKVKDTESGDGQLSMDYSKYQLVEVGDFAMNHMDLLTGYVDISLFRGVTSPDYRVFSLRPNQRCSAYYLYVLQMGYTNRLFYKFGQGASHLGRWRLPTEEFNDFLFTCPPDEDKEKIAAFLDHETAKIDTLIEKQQQLIKLLKEKRQAVISHAVTKGLNPDVPMKDSGVEWLGEVPEHWKVTRLKYHISTFEQGWSPQCDARPAEIGEYGVLKVGCVNYGVFNATENKALPTDLQPVTQYSLQKGDLLISRANTKELVGSAAVVDEDYDYLLLCDKLYRIKFDEMVLPEWVALFLSISVVRQQIELEATGASQSMQNIGQSTIKELSVALPPIHEATQLLDELNVKTQALGITLQKAAEQIALLQERRAALISAAVTGKIDVRGWQAPDSASKEAA